MNYSLMFYPWCNRRGERVLKRTKKVQNVSCTCLYTWTLSPPKGVFFPLTYISPALSTSAEWELPGADKSPVICQTSPPCPALLFSCILLSVIESTNSEKLLSIWIQSSTCETHSMADFFFPWCCWITQALVPHTLSPDVRDNVTVKTTKKDGYRR